MLCLWTFSTCVRQAQCDVSSTGPHGVLLQYPVSTPEVPCEYLGARCALRRVVLRGACVPRHTRSAGVLTHARSAAACVAPGCVVGCANTDSAARAPMRWTAYPERRCRLRLVYLLQPVDCRAVRLALPCELPLRRAEDLAEPEPHFVHHLRLSPMPFNASAGGRKFPNGCGPTVGNRSRLPRKVPPGCPL